MTTLYFEASDEDDLRKTGFSKDGKHQHPQIYLGLLVRWRVKQFGLIRAAGDRNTQETLPRYGC